MSFIKELKRIGMNMSCINMPKYIGRICMFNLNDYVVGKMEFSHGIYGNEYDRIKITLINKREAIIDTQTFIIGDLIGYKDIYGNKKSPYIWDCENNWYGYIPTTKDYITIATALNDYISCFM